MLMNQVDKEAPSVSVQDDTVFRVGDEPIMQSALEVLTRLSKKKIIQIYARGNSIPNAVAIANIITEKMLHGNSKIEKIHLDSEIASDGRMLSTVTIILKMS